MFVKVSRAFLRHSVWCTVNTTRLPFASQRRSLVSAMYLPVGSLSVASLFDARVQTTGSHVSPFHASMASCDPSGDHFIERTARLSAKIGVRWALRASTAQRRTGVACT